MSEHLPGEPTTPAWNPAPVPPATSTDDATDPAGTSAPAPRSRRRQAVAAGAAGLLLVGGVAGFGIGRATSSDAPTVGPTGQQRPGGNGFEGPGQDGGDGRGFPGGPDDGNGGGSRDGTQDGTQDGSGTSGDPT